MLSVTKTLFAFAIIAFLFCDPALANKFETISKGVSGSFRIKREFLQWAFLVGGSGFLFAALLAVITPHKNASFLNFANWKRSAIVLSIIGICLLIAWQLV